jgi:hypothetical protein
MKLKFLQNVFSFIPYSPKNEDFYYEFDYPKYQIKNNSKYTVLPIQSRDPAELPEPKTALDYEVWATTWGTEPTVAISEFEKLLNPSQNKYKGIVYYIIPPRGDTFSGENGYRDHRAVGFTCDIKGITWEDFKHRLELTPKGRRIVDVNVYWWSEIWPYTPNKFNYYKNTTDGTTYQNTRFLTPWTEKLTNDAAISFNGFLNLTHKDGISFDYLTSDFEGPNLQSMTIDGYNAFLPAGYEDQRWGLNGGITADARTISAWLADSRFTDYKFPKTGKSFADLFFENYIAIANADPNIVNKPEIYNHKIWSLGLIPYYSSSGNFVEQPQRSGVGAEYSIPMDSAQTPTGVVYRNGFSSINQFSIDTDTDSNGNWTNTINDYGPVKLMGQTLDNVKQFITGLFTAVALKNNGYVIPWGAAFTPELNGTDETGEAYIPEYTTPFFGDLILPGIPTRILGVTLEAKYVAITQDRLCAIKTDNTVVCWGGLSTSWDPSNPDIVNLPSGLTANKILGGYSHFIALQGNGGVTCWGDNTFGQCDVPVGIVAKDVSAGLAHTCAVLSNNTITCWGDNTEGQCTVPVGLTAEQVVCGTYFTRAVKKNGNVVCWGLADETTGYPLGTNNEEQGIVQQPATGQYVKLAGITLDNVESISPSFWNSNANFNVINTKVIYRPKSALEILNPFLGVTFSGITGARYVAEYWTPYGCEGSITCGCGPLGSADLKKSLFSELDGYTYSMYSMFHVLAPAWMSTVSELQMNNYLKTIFYDNYKKPEYPSYNKIEFLTYEFPPVSSEETPYSQDSNIQKRSRPSMPWANTGRPYYFSNATNLMFTTYAYDFATGDGITYQGSYRQAWDLRSGYIQNPQTDIEKYNFNGYLDINAGVTCSEWHDRLVRYPITNKFPEGENRINFYKFADEYLWKVFVSFIKDLRQDLRSDPTLWQRFTPWITFPGIWPLLIGFAGDEKIRQSKLIIGYWLLLSGAKLLQCFQNGGEQVQRTLDIWRVLTTNSRVRPCSNSTANANLPVDRIILQDAFEQYIISGGKNLKTGEYHWRITVPPTVFGQDDTVTLTRVGTNSDFPETVILDRNASYPENRFGFWLKSLSQIVPEYTVS